MLRDQRSYAALAILVAMVQTTDSPAQAEASVWYFGRHVIVDFSILPPAVYTNSAMSAVEGSAGIASNVAGPLFYANGDTVWNANHQPMPNGTGLMGHWSSSQTALIVPFPTDPSKYYLFNTDAGENFGSNGLRYSVIDMTLDGGLGDVTAIKNVLLNSPTTEKLTAVRHANGVDYWVLAHHLGNAEYLAFQVSPGGVSATPVTSTLGTVLSNGSGSVGQMKFSPDGTKVAVAGLTSPTDIQLFHFDAATGVLYDPLMLSSTDLYGCYGMEFSPYGDKLYSACDMDQTIRQFDLSSWNEAAILASGVVVGSPSGIRIGALQLAIDGKIYAAHNSWSMGGTHLGAIQQPQAAGLACDYVDLAVDLSGERCYFGLPSFVQSYFAPEIPQGTTGQEVSSGIVLPTLFDAELTVRLPASADAASVLQLFDATGRRVLARTFPPDGSLTINDQLPAGAYLLLINSGDGHALASGKLMKL